MSEEIPDMSGSFTAIPLAIIQKDIGQCISDLKGETEANFSLTLLELLSIAEYLKDAQRWAYIRDHALIPSPSLTSAQVIKEIDHQLEKEDGNARVSEKSGSRKAGT